MKLWTRYSQNYVFKVDVLEEFDILSYINFYLFK